MNDAELLERILEGDALPDVDVPASLDRLAMLADMVTHTAEPAQSTMRSEARDSLRNALIREANVRASDAPPLLTRIREAITATAERFAYSSRAAVAGGAAAMVLSTGGVAAAAQLSLPGDLFYSLKLSAQDAALSFSDAGLPLGNGLLSKAIDRIAEAETAVRRDRTTDAGTALRLADEDTRAGAQEILTVYLDNGDTAVLADLGDWVVTTNRRLDFMPTLADEPGQALADLRTTLNRIGQRIEVLTTGACSSCALGVHDRPDAPPTQARGTEADGTPPTPGGDPVDLTFIPAANKPFQACPCVGVAPPGTATPAPVGSADPTAEPVSDQPPRTGGGAGGSGSGGGSGGGGGGGGLPAPVPVPDVGPVTQPLPDPVRDAVEQIIEQIPVDPGRGPASAPASTPAEPEAPAAAPAASTP